MSDGQGGKGPRRLIALLVLLLIAVPLVVVALVTSGNDSPGSGLRIERSTVSSALQIVVYVEDQGANVAATAHGKPTVELECLDREGNSVLRGVYPWPFTDTDQGTFEPHIHHTVTGDQQRRITRCRLNGTEGPLSGTS